MAEYQLEPSPTRAGDQLHSDVPGYQRQFVSPDAPTSVTINEYIKIGDFVYENGVFSNDISVGGDATYASRLARYVRTGENITFTISMSINTIGTGSTTDISGLPYAPLTATAVVVSQLISSATNVVSISGLIAALGTTISLRSRTVASASDATNAIFGNATSIVISGSYVANI